jgi:hypothetical protein
MQAQGFRQGPLGFFAAASGHGCCERKWNDPFYSIGSAFIAVHVLVILCLVLD